MAKVDGKDLLNKMQAKMIEFANASGINLEAEFGSVEKWKEFVIAFTFKNLTEVGLSVEEAYNLIFGDGEYEKLFELTWNTLKEKASA